MAVSTHLFSQHQCSQKMGVGTSVPYVAMYVKEHGKQGKQVNLHDLNLPLL